jgi:hypothetical protein
MFFTSRDRFFRYLRGVLIGLPVWYVIGILMTFSDNFAGSSASVKLIPQRQCCINMSVLCLATSAQGSSAIFSKAGRKRYFFSMDLSAFLLLFTFYIIKMKPAFT